MTEYQGRSKANVKRVWFLPFDCDLADFLTMSKDEVYALSQDEINGYLPDFVEAATGAITAQSLPISGVEYTGHGILVRTRLSYPDSDRVAEIDTALKTIVKRINTAAGFPLVDPSGTDAGTRIVRIVGSLNGKSLKYGQPARQTRSLFESDETMRVADLLRIAAEPRKGATVTPILADHGKRLSDADAQAVVDAVAPHWQLGVKHKAALSLAGRLAKAGVPEAQALAIIEALAAQDEKPWDRAKCVASSYARMRAGANVLGYFGMAAWLPQDAVDFVDGKLEAFRATTQGRILQRGETKRETPVADLVFRADPVPEQCFHGWFAAYHALVEPTTEASDAFHLGAGLTLAAAMIGRRVRLSFASDPLYANLYAVLIGPSGSSRKDTAIKRAIRIPQLNLNPHVWINPTYHIARDISSAEGLITVLKDHNNTLLYLTELSAMLANARRKSTSTILDRLIEAWDTPHVLENLNKLSPQVATNPYLSIIAATQPGRFAAQISDEDIHSGFANRWLFLPGVGKEPRANPPSLNEPAAWKLYLDLKAVIEAYPENHLMRMDADASERWSVWYLAQVAAMGRDEDEDAMRVRHGALIHKLALIYAVTDGAQAVQLVHLETAIALVDWMWVGVKRLMREWGVTRDVQIENRIIDTLERKGPMKRRALQQLCSNRKWSAREFVAAFEAMVKNGTIVTDQAGLVGLPLDEEESL